jgi:hypothetical protein
LPGVFDQHFNGGAQGLAETLWWSAQSHVARYAEDNRGIGRFAGITLDKLVTPAERLIDEPFIAGRQYERWTSAVGRLTCCHLWALYVVAATPAAYAAQTDVLRTMAAEHAAFLFRSAGDTYQDQGNMMGRLALTVVDYLEEKIALDWTLDALLPDYVRVLAAWGCTTIVRDHPALAADLFARIAEEPLSVHGRDRQINRLVTVVDWIVARAWKRQDHACVSHLNGAWSRCRHNWTAALTGPLFDAPSWFWTALQGDDEARAQLLADARFARTACVAQLNRSEAA